MKAPFPWFGGKRRVADRVWSALGDVDNFIEPFAGSLAVLLERPDSHDRKAETVNDRDGYLANFWRALAADPDGVALHCDWPVNETDLIARHSWLVREGPERLARLDGDPDFYDVKVAGWWVWGINSWIGSGWCAGAGPWQAIDGKMVDTRQLPHLGDAGQGVNRQLPHLGNGHWYSERKSPDNLYGYFAALAARLRRVRVICGDWSRVVTEGACAYGDSVGVFLDPPYLGSVRTKDLYRTDDHDVADEVREWALSKGNDPRFRIVLAGYYDEHGGKMSGWREHRYSATKAYGTSSAVGSNNGNDANRHNECLWFSPYCVTEREHLFCEAVA